MPPTTNEPLCDDVTARSGTTATFATSCASLEPPKALTSPCVSTVAVLVTSPLAVRSMRARMGMSGALCPAAIVAVRVHTTWLPAAETHDQPLPPDPSERNVSSEGSVSVTVVGPTVSASPRFSTESMYVCTPLAVNVPTCVLVSLRSVLRTGVTTVAELFSGVGSPIWVAVAVFEIVPAAIGLTATVMSIDELAPPASDPVGRVQVTVPDDSEQDQPAPVADTNDVPAGSASDTVIGCVFARAAVVFVTSSL